MAQRVEKSEFKSGQYLDAIKSLHQTVISLRSALKESQEKVSQLTLANSNCQNFDAAVVSLSVENHALRRKILESTSEKKKTTKVQTLKVDSQENLLDGKEGIIKESKTKKASNFDGSEYKETFAQNSDLNLKSNANYKTCVEKSVNFKGKLITVNVNLDIQNNNMADETSEEQTTKVLELKHSPSSDLLDQDVDNIELIFTNEDTKEANLKEPLMSIDASNELRKPSASDFEQNLSAEISDHELEDDVFNNDNFENENQENANFQSQTFDFTRENSQIYNSKSDNSINQELKSFKSYYSSFQDSSFENRSMDKDESFDKFDERIRFLETDISKVGIQEVDYSMGRRNTCPNPFQYRPIIHREAMNRGPNSRRPRPILGTSNAMRKESGAQTEITALPSNSSWRSESNLAHKVKLDEPFTTLPSKCPMPGTKIRLSEKTSVEARRVLLSDIGFTSMVPELSRSADHLCQQSSALKQTTASPAYGQFLKTTDLCSPGYSQNEMWSSQSPNSHKQSGQSMRYSNNSFPVASTSKRRCSAPVSPNRRSYLLRHTSSKVRFANGSLPELRSDWNNTTLDSGDSTDSLIDESEQYLRRSIDCILGSRHTSYHTTGMSRVSGGLLRRASAPEPSGDNVPPPGWQPFLPRLPRDLRLDYWVKVITQEGRVRGGRVRYVGHLISHTDQFVGVQLSTPEGYSDGTYNNRRYFQCEPYHGIFVPFKKVIMGWKP